MRESSLGWGSEKSFRDFSVSEPGPVVSQQAK
jgi:hypothetical protein